MTTETVLEEFSRDQLLDFYKDMLRIRAFEDETLKYYEVAKVYGMLHVAHGKEALAVGFAKNIKPNDFVLASYRAHDHALMKGIDMYRLAAELMGRTTGINKGKAGSMHIMDDKVRFLEDSVVGGQIPIANGIAFAFKYLGENSIVVCFFGDGACNIGAFHETLNMASLLKLPIVFVVENNKWAITTHISISTSVDKIVKRAVAYNMIGMEVDGTDVLAVYKVAKKAINIARNEKKPVLVEAHTVRIRGHYDGDPQPYRPKEDVEQHRKNDPIPKFRAKLFELGVLNEELDKKLWEAARLEAETAYKKADKDPFPPPEEALTDVFPGEEAKLPPELTLLSIKDAEKAANMRTITYAKAINEALHEEMEKDDRIFILGEDIRWGGVYRVTEGLLERFGPERVINTPIAEEAITGLILGAAMIGLRPIAELMYTFTYTIAMDQVTNHIAKIPYMSGGKFKVPLVIRAPNYTLASVGAQHSVRNEAWFMHTPGLKVVITATPFDAKGLMKTAIRENNPVLFFEHARLYHVRGPVPDKEYFIPLGKADVKREGSDITIITYSRPLYDVLKAAEQLSKEGIEAEVIDLRSLVPLDEETIISSVKKTGKVVIVEEDEIVCGVGAEIAALIMEKAFDYLDAPVKRVGAPMVPIPFSKPLEQYVVPDAENVIKAVKEVLGLT
ncbi:MAG: dehydrogenase [Thermoprotei archaeon]|mgnify:CR=1 FL=1|nr:MAG: dehydrogenase [Thermoprotei archaeon]